MNNYKSLLLILMAVALTAHASLAQDNSISPVTITLEEAVDPGRVDQYGNHQYTISGPNEVWLQPGQGLTIYVSNPDSYFKVGYSMPTACDTEPFISCDLPWFQGVGVLHRNQALDENGDPLSFHFVAAKTGTEVVTCTIRNEGSEFPILEKLLIVGSFPITVHVQSSQF